jgi:plasmid stabilization system protein ParE
MKYKLNILPEAENDVREAFLWYESIRLGLGYDFLMQVDAGMRFIERNPDACSSGYKNTRKCLIKRFPFKIIYLAEEDRVTVLGVLHGKRNPELARKRVNGN